MKAVAKEERRVAYPLVLVFAILSLGIVVGGTFYYRNYERQFRTGIESQLSAIAELKADQLAQYRKERLGDAATFFQNAAFSGLVRRFFDHPEDADAQEQLRTWLDKYQTDHYDRVFLLDTQGVERMSTPVTAAPGSAVVSRLVAEVLQSRKIAFQDFHRNEHNQRIYLTLLVPIFDGPDYSRALGVIALRVDTATYLYPFISRWPTPSRTAETLLVRRDGKDVLFLNELKFGTNTVLNLRISLENTNVAAVKAVLGQKGVVESMDYRGVPVLAALQAIPDSPWFLIARMDTAEVYAPLRERLWLTLLLVGALLAGASAGVGAIWRHQRVRFYKERSKVAEALRENEERLRSHTDNSPMAVVEWNAGLIITRWTGAAEKMFGWSAEEAIGKPITELPGICEEDLPIVQSVIQQLADGVSKHVFSSNRNRTRNGQVIHCEWYNSVLHDAGGKTISVLSQVLDITERKRAEETIARERQLLRTLIDLLRETFYVKDLDSRFLVVNETLAKQYGKDTPSQLLGLSDADLYPAGLAAEFRAEEMKVFAGEPLIAHEDSMVFLDGRTHTVLTTKLPFRDGQGRICGLVGIGQDITERKRAEDELRRTNTFLDSIIENLPNMMFLKDARTLRFVRFNRAGVNLLGCSEADLLGKTDYDFFPKELADFFTEKDRQVLRGKEVVDIPEEPLQTRDKGERILHTRKVPILNANGEPEYLLGISEDITARKRAEEALRESQALYHSLVEQLPVGVFRKDPAGRYVLVNPWFCRLKGMKAEEFLGKTPQEVAASDVAKQDPTGLAVEYAAAGGGHHEQIMQTGKSIELVEEYTNADGRKQFVHAMKLPVFDPGGKVIGTQGLLFDITEIKQASEALHHEQTLMATLMETLPDPVYFKDAASRFLRVNPALARKLGLGDPARVVGKTDADFFTEEHASKALADEQEIIRTGQPLVNVEEKETWPDGSETWVLTTKLPLRDDAGRTIGTCGISSNITERKRTEEALRLNQERLLKVITQTRCILNSGQVEGPENWRERALNPETPFHWDFPVQNEETAQKILPLELAAGERYQQAWTRRRSHADHTQMNWNSGNAFLNDLPFYRNEFRCIDKHGAGHWMQQFVTVRKLAENRWEVFGITTDISDLKRVEAELRWSETGLQATLESTADGILAVDNKGKVIKANRRFAELWRIPQSLMDAGDDRALLDFVLKQLSDPDAFLKKVQLLYSTDAVEMDMLAFKDGRIFERYTSPMMMEGAVIGRVWSFRDITERKRVEQALAERTEEVFQRNLELAGTNTTLQQQIAERERIEQVLDRERLLLRTLIDNLPDYVYAMDAEGRFIIANVAVARQLGFSSPNEVIGKSNFDLFPHELATRYHADEQKIIRSGQGLYNHEGPTVDASKKEKNRWVSTTKVPLRNAQGEIAGFIGLGHDITERKRQEEELKQKNSELERFTYTVSHDLKSPLVTVKTFLGYLEQDLARPDMERVKQDVAYMHTATEKMGQLLDELLNLARVGRKKNPVVRVTFRELAQEALRLVAGRISTGGVKVQVADAVVTLEGDRSRLMEIWQNLVENACKFMGNQPQPQVEIGVEKRGPETIFFVRDNGAGIDPRYQAKVFGLFEQLNPKGEGTGMGLALVKRIVELYEGRIWVESAGPGQGANFLFTLPAAVIVEMEQSS
jgi:PAS domain S-box-containing protein